nr:malonate decarboxylase holo-[acyl-carrier-protein] synthase [Schlegelella koreensis]
MQRQRLIRLTSAGWRRLVAQAPSDDVARCIADWAAHDRPLVVARQRTPASARVLVGLPAPAEWGRRRIALEIEPRDVASVGAFPPLVDVADLLPAALHAPVFALEQALRTNAASARVYGSFGWQRLTGLAYLHADSDLDLLVHVHDVQSADAAVAALRRAEDAFAAAAAAPARKPAASASSGGAPAPVARTPAPAAPAPLPALPRLDGELVFDDGHAVAWREWAAWRAGQSRQMLVKTTVGASLVSGPGWMPHLVGPPAAALARTGR